MAARVQTKRGLKASIPVAGMLAGEQHFATDRGTLHIATGATTTIPVVPPVDDLVSIAGAGVDAANDLVLIHDASAVGVKEKRITVAQLAVAMGEFSLAADSTPNSTLTLATSLLSFAVVAGGIYWFRAFVSYSAPGTTVGARVVPNGPAFSRLRHSQYRANSATTDQIFHGQAAWQLPAAANANGPTGGGELVIEGTVSITAAGAIAIQYASETAGQAISLLAGSYIEFRRVN